MNWINPRDELPNQGQLVWCIKIKNRKGDRVGLPAASIILAEAHKDHYGVVTVEEIHYKGYPQYKKYFFEWWHYDQSGKEEGEDIYKAFGEEEMVDAWMPFNENDIPSWDYIGIEESKDILKNSQEYKKGLEHENNKRLIDKATGGMRHFINLPTRPTESGIYVVANSGGVWLSRFDETCNPWIAPNGNPVSAWYPVPSHY